jgi:hypothetical protein
MFYVIRSQFIQVMFRNNPQEAVAYARIYKNLVKLPTLTKNNSIVIITRFTGQVMAIRNLLAQMGLLDNYNIKVMTATRDEEG